MNILYTLSFPEPHTHYMQVELAVSGFTASGAQLKMAVWTPGSYLIREFQRHIDFVNAELDGVEVRLQKSDKNTWLLPSLKSDSFKIKYNLYCNDLSVRTNFVNDEFALINGAGTFLFLEGFEKNEIEVLLAPYPKWKNCSTALSVSGDTIFRRIAADIDELIDSPILLGNQQQYFFESCSVKHELALLGDSNCQPEKLIADLQKVIPEEVKIFGEHPCENYTFINIHTHTTYGGLEHKHCSVNMLPRHNFDKKNYGQSLGLLSHEYFHLWNVKRIRPNTLSTYNYHTEAYTDLLWFFEGVTSYYDDLVICRANVFSQQEYLELVINNINAVLNSAGICTQTLAESSFDTWLKYYRKNENSNNSTISYYNKGSIVAMLFDIMLMDATNAEKSLDDVMRELYHMYKQNPDSGVSEEDLITVFNSVGNMDFRPYFEKFIHSTSNLDLRFYFELMGLQLSDMADSNSIHLGFMAVWKEGKFIVSEVAKGYGAYAGGLNAEDEIIAIDGYRITSDYTKLFAHKKATDCIELLICRQGAIKTISIPVTMDKRHKFKLTALTQTTDKQHKMYKKWLR